MQHLLVITPCLDSAHVIDETIVSVVTQSGNFHLHYHVQDGGSRDGTLDKLEEWSRRLRGNDWPHLCKKLVFTYESGPDNSHYDAINQSFSRHEGHLTDDSMCTWINAGDRLELGALQTISAIRRRFPDVAWLSGGFAQINDEGCPISYRPGTALSSKAIAAGLHDGRRLGFIQQEGIFWSHALWKAAGGQLNPDLRLAGDFDLWRRFAMHAPCFSHATVTGFFRRHSDSLSHDLERYFSEVDSLFNDAGVKTREQVFEELRQLFAANDRNALGNAGFAGPVIVWDRGTNQWGRHLALVTPQESLVTPV